MKHQCPVCHKTIQSPTKEPTEKAPFFPFCSQRCKLIDLGAWLDAEYRITCESQSDESQPSSDDVHRDSEVE